MLINFKTVKEKIFPNSNLMKYLKKYDYLYNQWKISQIIPEFKQNANKSIWVFLENLKKDDESVKIISNHFKVDNVVIEAVDKSMVQLAKISIKDQFDTDYNFTEFCIYRDSETIEITMVK